MIWMEEFWQFLERLIAEKKIVIDRPRGSAHPRYSDMIYPLDYGFLEGTRTGDGAGIDVWRGVSGEQRVSGLLCTVDLKKGDAEIKILVGCTGQETQAILQFLNSDSMRAIYVKLGI